MLTAETFVEMPEHGNVSANLAICPLRLSAEALVSNHQRLVRSIARQVHLRMSSAIEYDDLVQIGSIALVEAARNFEDRGISFAGYASMRIRGAMIDTLRRDARIGRSGMKTKRQLAAVRKALEQRLMRNPTDAEIAGEMGLDSSRYYAMANSAQAVFEQSIDDAYSDHDVAFADRTGNAETQLADEQMRNSLANNIKSLPERDQQVLQLYFIEEMNLEEIGLTLDLGAARICQIKKAAIEKLRSVMVN